MFFLLPVIAGVISSAAATAGEVALGIGAATANEFAKKNYDIILHYFTSKDSVIKLKNDLEKKYNTSVYLVQADLSKEEDILTLVTNIKLSYSKIDVLVNNAALSIDCDILEKSKNQFLKVLEVNLIAPFLLIKELSCLLQEGVVINISSTDADDTGSSLNIDYSASKAGLNSLTKTLSLAFSNIRICAVAPNWVKTEAVQEMDKEYLNSELKRIGQQYLISPEEVAQKIINIVENENYISGSIIKITGKEEK